MNRLELILVATFLIIITFFGISEPRNSFEWLLGAHEGLDVIRFTLALLLLTFGLFAPRYGVMTANVMRVTGLFMFGLLAGNLMFPDLSARAGIHLFSLDIIGLIEGGIICTLYSFGDPELDTTTGENLSKPDARVAKHA